MYRRYLSIICLLSLFLGCGGLSTQNNERLLQATRIPATETGTFIGALLTEQQMDMLVAGQGCFGLVEGHESCCDWVRRNFTWLWSFHLVGAAEAAAAHIEGRRSGRCF